MGRSYNGYEWEGVMPSPVTFQCTNATSPVTCTTILPNASYQLRLYNGTELGTEQLASNPATVASRFLTQTTFGPTLGEIGNLSASTIEETETRMADWLLRQMEMEPSLHRAYVRRRWNPKSDNAPHVMMRPPCKEGSSWVDVAFSDMDRGKTVDVSLTPDGSYSLSIDGIVRTVIQNPKDVREDLKYSCYKRGYRTPLDMGGQGSTDEVSLEACHVRCVATTGCGYFSFLPSLSANPSPPSDGSSPGECHLQAADSHYLRGLGGQWRSGPADCADSVYEYPPADSGLLHMGHSCWPQCRAHGSCPDRCGANGYCCKFGRDINGCVTTDTSATTHRCIPNPSMAAPPNSPAPRLQANESYVVCWVPEYEGGEVALLLPGVPFIRTNPAWKMKECAAALDEMIVIGNPIVNLTDPDAFITQQFDGIVMDPITAGAARNSFALRNDAFSDANCRLPNNPTVFIRHAGRFFRHDPRLQLMDNTIDAPHIETRIDSQRDRTFVPSLTPTFCTAVKQSFTNSRGCVRQNSCSQPVWSGGTLTLDEQLLRQLFTRSQKYVYYVTGLRLDGEQGYLGRGFSDSEISPCSATTRWQTTVGACDADTPLDDDTLASLSAALTTGGIHHNHTRIGVPVNVAIGKLATAFSVAWPRQFPAGLGNDGNTAGDWGQGSCTHTTAGANSWWQVDLGATFNVDSINVYHRTDSNQHEFRVNGGIVRISDTTDYSTGMQCGGALAEGGFSGVDMLDCGGQSGQFVTVTNDFITVCEVEVMAPLTTPSDADLLPALTKLFAFSPEFSATNVNSLQENARPAIPEIPTQNRAYKAIVVMFLEGGVDSFNILVPHSNCTVAGEVTDLYTEYARIRSSVALGLQELLPLDNLDTLDNAQPCSTFGTHPNLGLVKNLWDAGQASWFANIGCLIKPTTRADFMAGDRPPFLFGHDSQQREIQSVHAQNSGANGVLGRILNAVTSQAEPYRSVQVQPYIKSSFSRHKIVVLNRKIIIFM